MWGGGGACDVPLLFIFHRWTGNQKGKLYFVDQCVIFQNYMYPTYCEPAVAAMHSPIKSGNKAHFDPFRYIYHPYGDQ